MTNLPASKFDERNRLIDEVYFGRMTPPQAEAEAGRLKLRLLKSVPDPSRYDPMTKAVWTLAMVVAWISWRTPERVRISWDEYSQECWDWRRHHSRLPIDGGRRWEEASGWTLEQNNIPTLSRLSYFEAIDSEGVRRQGF